MKLLADADGDITIEFANNVRTISSTYIGALFNIHIMADQIGRKLTIVCHSSLSRWINMVSGNKILNIQTIAADAGMSSKTVESWLSILETSYIIYRLKPFHKNYNKRIIKSLI